MFKNSFTICVDMDDTIENLLPAWVNWLNGRYDLDVQVEDCRSWNMGDNYPMLTESQIVEPLSTKRFWDSVQPKSDAQYYINKLVQEHQDVYIVTASHYGTVGYKMRALIEKFFPAIDWRHIIISSNKQMLKCDVMVDDGPHNLIDGDYHKLLFSTVTNESFDAERHKIKRVHNWEQIYAYLEDLDWFYHLYDLQTVNNLK